MADVDNAALARKIDGLQHALDSRLDTLSADVARLRAYVIEGNGRPSLLNRVDQLETHRQHDRDHAEAQGDALGQVQRRLTAIDGKLDQAAADRAKAAEDALAAAEQYRKDRIGWAIGFLGVLTTVLQVAASYFGR